MKKQFTLPTDPAVLAYAAGLFDGEGTVQISKPFSKKNNKRYHRLDVCIAQKDPRPVLWMKDHFGGRIQWRRRSIGSISYWILNHQPAADFLAAIRPYLVLKGEQADIAFAFRATVGKVTGNKRIIGKWRKEAFQHPAPVDDLLEAKRDEFRDQMQKLKVVK
jgi:hypothetical protein